MTDEHYNQTPRRQARFINPPNNLKSKAGNGGLNESILEKAQALLERNSDEFPPMAWRLLKQLEEAIRQAEAAANDNKNANDAEDRINAIIYPAMQLKANGGMFKYPLVTKIADRLVQFLEVIEKPDEEVLEICHAFHTTIDAVMAGRIQGGGGEYGDELTEALIKACIRYFDKNPENISDK